MIKKEIIDSLSGITEEEQTILNGADIDREKYMMKKNDIVSHKKILPQGKLIAIRPHTRFTDFPEHSHDYIEVVYMCRGSTTHIIGGDTIRLSEGEILFLGKTARHRIKQAEASDIAVNFIILPQFFERLLEMIGDADSPLRRFLTDILTGSAKMQSYLYFKVSDILPIQNLIENLLWTLISALPNKTRVNETTMGLLFMLLMSYTDHISYDNSDDLAIVKLMGYIDENYKNGSLADAARSLHYDMFWLSREIKQRTGKNYTDLIREKRLSKAALMLRSTSLNVANIAESIGYSNISYFYRIFEEFFGCTPRDYRTRAKKDIF